jgi:hypothetical protein
MKSGIALILSVSLSFAIAPLASSQKTVQDQSVQTKAKIKKSKKGRTAGGDIASGSGKIAGGAAKGAGHAAEGVGKGAADLATLHPLNAAGDVSKGGVSAGKDVAKGTGKGAGKIAKGIGKGIKHIF